MRRPRRGLAIASLVVGVLSLPTLGLLFVGAVAGIVLGVVALVKARREPEAYGGQGLAIAGIALCAFSIVVMPFVLGIVAAIAIPSLLRARVAANEAAAIGDVRAVLSAQEAYRAMNGGFYGTAACLGAPERCVPGYAGPPLLPADVASLEERSGYQRHFHAVATPDGPPLEASGLPPAADSSPRLTSYAYVATPVQPDQTGVRTFCGDASGRVCQWPDGPLPEIVDGACPADCDPLP